MDMEMPRHHWKKRKKPQMLRILVDRPGVVELFVDRLGMPETWVSWGYPIVQHWTSYIASMNPEYVCYHVFLNP